MILCLFLGLVVSFLSTCWSRPIYSFGGRIVGGKNADIKDYPYQLSLEHFGEHVCGATLIRPNVAITAAHCTEQMKGFEHYLRFRAGTSKIYMGGQLSRSAAICDHPQYDSSTYDYDISVVLLKNSFSLETKIQTIDLQTVDTEIPNGLLSNVTGWGDLREGGLISQQLQVVQVPKVDETVCDFTMRSLGNSTTDRMICFGYTDGGKDSCNGDSGGPLVIDNKLVGVVSWGRGCARPGIPTLYTKIANHDVHQHINNCIDKFGLE